MISCRGGGNWSVSFNNSQFWTTYIHESFNDITCSVDSSSCAGTIYINLVYVHSCRCSCVGDSYIVINICQFCAKLKVSIKFALKSIPNIVYTAHSLLSLQPMCVADKLCAVIYNFSRYIYPVHDVR